MTILNPFASIIAPTPDRDVFNVTVSIDPNWPHLAQFGASGAAQPVQLMYRSVTMAFGDMADEGLTEAFPANYATTDVLGRAEQFKTFTGSGNRTFTITFRFVMQGDVSSDVITIPISTGGDTPAAETYSGYGSAEAQVVKPARWLESLKNPVPDMKPDVGLSFAPPPVLVVVGNILAARCVVADAQIHWVGPFEPGTMYPLMAEVPVTFEVVRASLTVENAYASAGGNAAYYSQFFTFPTSGPANTGGT